MKVDPKNKEVVDYWLKNKKEAFARGQWREVDRINKILKFYGMDDKTTAKLRQVEAA